MNWRSIGLYMIGGVALMSSMAAGQAAKPEALVPFAMNKVQVDGVLSPEEWSDAAVLRRFGPNLSTPADPPVTLYIKHDGDAILAAFRCQERDPNYPRAAARAATGTLNLDDAVQIVLGLADSNVVQRDVLNMGGYEGAMGTQAVSADHYYQFTVNAVGAVARTYNEVPLENPRFTAAVGKDHGGWTAEMRIPLASIGVSASDGQALFFNAFRFRPPQMAAWYMPGFGGYYPMPFGKMTLLPANHGKDRTVESPMIALKSPLRAVAPLGGAIGYYPLSGCILGSVTQPEPAQADRAVLRVSGLPDKEIPLNSDLRQQVRVDIPKGAQPARTAELLIYNKQKLLTQVKRDLPAVAEQEWIGTHAGADYIKEKIPAPWRRPEIEKNVVTLIDKKLRFGAFGLPESIAGASEILAGPIEIVAARNERALKMQQTQATRMRQDGNQVFAEAAAADGPVHIQVRTRLDYDGFMVVKMKLSGISGAQLSRFAVRIPLKKEAAKFYHRTLVQDAGALDGYGFDAPAGSLWCGAEEQGLAFSYDTNPFVSADKRHQMRLIEQADRVWMELNFVDAPGQYKESERIFRFFLQPTPTKPMDLTKIHPSVEWQWENWSDYQGYPDLAKIPALRQWTDKLHPKNHLGLLYTCQGLAENSPGFKEFSDDLLMIPKWIFYRRAFNPGRNIACYATCKRGPEGDLQLWAFEKLVKEAHIDGTVSDGLSLAWGCDNPGHQHDETVSWDDDVDSRIVAQRTFLKRLRGIFNESGRPFYMAAHTGGGLDINTLSFFDGYMEGEQLARYPRDYQIPLAQYIVGYSGRPWGLRTAFWEKTWRRNKGFYWSLTYALLHDNELEDSPIVRDVLSGFDDQPGTEYFPYWRKGPHVAASSARNVVKVSYYRRDDSALVVAGNPSVTDDRVELDLNGLYQNRTLSAVEMISGEALTLRNNRWVCELPAGRCVAIRIQPRTETSASQMQAIRLARESWKLNGRQNGVSLASVQDAGGQPIVRLSSTQWADEARAEMTALALTPEGSLSLMVRHAGRMRFSVGKSIVQWDSGWQADGFTQELGAIYQPTVTHDRYVPVEITVRGQRMDMTYDGKPLARGLVLPSTESCNLVLSTWAGNAIDIAGGTAAAASKDLYVPGLGVGRVKMVDGSPDPFIKPNLTDRNSWDVNQGAAGVKFSAAILNGKESWKMESTPYQAAPRAMLRDVLLQRDGTLVIAFKANNRFRVNFGNIGINHDGKWSVIGPLNGWSEGQLYQVPLDPKNTYTLALTVHDGLVNIALDDKMIVKDMLFDLADDKNRVSVETWGGDSVEFYGIDILNSGRKISSRQNKHPIW